MTTVDAPPASATEDRRPRRRRWPLRIVTLVVVLLLMAASGGIGFAIGKTITEDDCAAAVGDGQFLEGLALRADGLLAEGRANDARDELRQVLDRASEFAAHRADCDDTFGGPTVVTPP